jgi:CheY-like chemotaxis protein
MVAIAVADTGSGMSPETLSRAVEPFFTTKDIGKGSGLGLSMVFGFAKQSGGDLRIESELGKGTRITILLPAARAPSSGSAPSEPHPPAPRAIRVLVVDDDELVRDALCMQLTDAGFTTIQAQDGPAALALIDAGIEFDLLFTDMVMPHGMSGVTLAEQVRTRRPDVCVIVSTGYVEKELPEGGPNWQLLRKPYTSGALFTVLQNVMLDRR